MLTFEYEPDSVLEVTFDADGLRELLDMLGKLTAGDHEHLFTEPWGGYQLSEDFPNPDLIPVHKVTLNFVGEAG